ncbi:hypothetical protein B0T24DRAFT_208396 [Lasiosphaeria ovina]|uniref:Uncharacterized protein n=1 Tax=Lasiosphaeria ovina TaxID=92902 RepID=A0AAE0N9M8_9PEZI|nr:hypothetical protein B0T24DRAFT_208396 [Lasiosphaeria ovina]
MNRFRTRRKAKDDSSTSRTSEDSEQSSMPSFKGFRRGKKSQQEEPKKEIDLATALPSNDDFRTSLLMSNLSARFSMLREQDDPSTKIGKASDDSVLYPKRQSRMADFGFSGGVGGLSDIAEVESIKASPFLRSDSFVSSDTDSTKGASVMNRAKPIEGNNLFGGRQKIYKIPVGSTMNTTAGVMGGRALYDDDVAMSAFQRWRQAERERRGSLDEEDTVQADGTDRARSDSPPVGYNRKRETSSTTSSASVMARNSTAATSITSQPTAANKEWQSVSPAPNSSTSGPTIERHVTRTRRLYEQGLSQEMHEQQSSALSRIDTLSRQRLGSRTPDLGAGSPSPTITTSNDRFFNERRPVLTKASAPNLRSISPPSSASPSGTVDLGLQLPNQPDLKTNFGVSPPLSPPISETEDQHILPIQPNDMGKATAMGVFQKPAQPYDESKYAQRQIQLQQGRETPTQRFRAESNASFATGRSRSSSSAQRQHFEAKSESIKTQPAVEEEATPVTPPVDAGFSLPIQSTTILPSATRLHLERPSDRDHPAFRESALPTPLTASARASAAPSPILEQPIISVSSSEQTSPDDSPTLGPTTTGLSGMVRQHLRSESNASSVYGPVPPTSSLDSRFPADSYELPPLEVLDNKSNPWMSSTPGWTESFYSDTPDTSLEKLKALDQPRHDFSSEPKGSNRSSDDIEDVTDEFANQLADARRRVREKLTSYAESDSSRAASPQPQPRTEPTRDLAVPGHSNQLSVGVKPKSSRGSLIDRSRNIVGGQSKAKKMLGIGAATMSSQPSPAKQSFDDNDARPLEPTAEIPKKDFVRETRAAPEAEAEVNPKSTQDDEDEDSNAHPGLRAFRQARRELQRRRELETLARHQASNTTQSRDPSIDQPSAAQSPPKADRVPRQRTPSRERKPPPIMYRQRGPSEEYSYGSNTNSPAPAPSSSERERSGSDTSGGRSASQQRPPRGRNNTGPHENHPGHINTRPPMLRTPGLPGTDIRHSPIMPPQGYPGRGGAAGAMSPAPSPQLSGSKSMANLAVHSGRSAFDPYSGQPSPISPISPMGLPPSPFTMRPDGSPVGTPTSLGPRPRRPSASQSPALGATTGSVTGPTKRIVDKRDISEPTFVMSTSRVPTVNLPHAATGPDAGTGGRQYGAPRSRSRSNSGGGAGPAPPLPPINPRRKREGSRPGPGYDDTYMAAPKLPFASQANGSQSSLDYNTDENRSGFSISDEDESNKADHRWRLRKTNMEANLSSRSLGGNAPNNSTQFVSKGPPASRTVATSGMKVNKGMGPGGMF